MARFIIVAIASGLLFGVLDGLINANHLARRLFEVYQPIARPSLKMTAGVLIDLVYGFALAGLFLLLFESLPGHAGLVKGLSFAAGLVEMGALGLLYGLALWPAAA
jgi:hypothetical protein